MELPCFKHIIYYVTIVNLSSQLFLCVIIINLRRDIVPDNQHNYIAVLRTVKYIGINMGERKSGTKQTKKRENMSTHGKIHTKHYTINAKRAKKRDILTEKRESGMKKKNALFDPLDPEARKA